MGSYSTCLRYSTSLGTLVWKGSQILYTVIIFNCRKTFQIISGGNHTYPWLWIHVMEMLFKTCLTKPSFQSVCKINGGEHVPFLPLKISQSYSILLLCIAKCVVDHSPKIRFHVWKLCTFVNFPITPPLSFSFLNPKSVHVKYLMERWYFVWWKIWLFNCTGNYKKTQLECSQLSTKEGYVRDFAESVWTCDFQINTFRINDGWLFNERQSTLSYLWK